MLSFARALERPMSRLPLGAQYMILSRYDRKPAPGSHPATHDG
jgi:hypothetical protein